MNRRSFLLGIGASLAAPAIVKAELIMPVRKVAPVILWSEKTLDRTNYLAILDNLSANGVPIPNSTYWKALGAELSKHIVLGMEREGFMRRILDRPVIDEAHIPRIKVRTNKIEAKSTNGSLYATSR